MQRLLGQSQARYWRLWGVLVIALQIVTFTIALTWALAMLACCVIQDRHWWTATDDTDDMQSWTRMPSRSEVER